MSGWGSIGGRRPYSTVVGVNKNEKENVQRSYEKQKKRIFIVIESHRPIILKRGLYFVKNKMD